MHEEVLTRKQKETLFLLKDIDYSEAIDYMKGFETPDETIKKNLTEISLQK